MRISADIKPLQADLKRIELEILERLEALVLKTASAITNAASKNTPIGDDASLRNNANYLSFYERRNEAYGIDINVGFHKGAWVYSENANIPFDNNIYSTSDSLQNVRSELYTNYQLGETFYIAAKGPAYTVLNSGANRQAPDGIMQPTVDEVIEIHKLNIQTFFDKG